MDLNQFLLIAGGLLVFSILLIGMGLVLYRYQKKDEETPEAKRTPSPAPVRDAPPWEAQVPAVSAPAEVPPAVQQTVGPPQPAAGGDPLEILRVYRRPIDGSLSLNVMGQRADHIGEMTPGQVEQLKKVVREIALWVENRSAPSSQGAVPTPEAGRRAGDPAPAESPGAPGPEAGEPAIEPNPRESITPGAYFADSLPPMPGARDLILGRRKKPEKQEESQEPPKSIAAQIDEILQGLLAASPRQGGDIRLSEDPGGGLSIVHGDRRYQAIDEVEDAEARVLIQRAVQLWNERNNLKN